MIQGLVVMNPRRAKLRRLRRSKLGRFTTKTKTNMKSYARRRSRRRVARKVRRNPPHSAAMRRKISLAVKRSIRLRRARGGATVSSRRSVRRSIRRSSAPVVRYRSRPSVARRFRARRRSGGGGGGSFRLGNIISKDNLMLAGGVIGSTLLSRVVLARVGGMLPGAAHPLGNAAYTLGIAVGGAYVTRRFSKSFAEGLIIGGLVTVVNSVLTMALPAAAVGEYLGAGYQATQSLGPVSQQMAREIAPTPQVDAYLDSQPAFENSAW